jgi:hypothetical protein
MRMFSELGTSSITWWFMIGLLTGLGVGATVAYKYTILNRVVSREVTYLMLMQAQRESPTVTAGTGEYTIPATEWANIPAVSYKRSKVDSYRSCMRTALVKLPIKDGWTKHECFVSVVDKQ